MLGRLMDIMVDTIKSNTDSIFLHALLRRFFDKKTITHGLDDTCDYVKWDTVRPKTTPEGEYVEQLFTYNFPNKPKTPAVELVPHLQRAAADSGNEEFKRMTIAALGNQKSIFGKLGEVSIAAHLLPGDEETCVTVDYYLDPCDMREVILLKQDLFSLFNDLLQLDNKTKEELHHIFADFGCSYHPGEEIYYPNIYFRETEFHVHNKVHCDHWYFMIIIEPPADKEGKIELYLHTLGETLGEETAINCMYAFDDTGFACKLTKAQAVKAWRKCLHRVYFLRPDLLMPSSSSSNSERQYSFDMEQFSGVDYVNKKRDLQQDFKRLKSVGCVSSHMEPILRG